MSDGNNIPRKASEFLRPCPQLQKYFRDLICIPILCMEFGSGSSDLGYLARPCFKKQTRKYHVKMEGEKKIVCQILSRVQETLTEEGSLDQNSTQSLQKETTCQQMNLALLASGARREGKPGFLEPCSLYVCKAATGNRYYHTRKSKYVCQS